MKKYDMIIVGAGVSGLAAGMYAGRLNLSTLVIGENKGGTIALTTDVENYPGFTSITGLELAKKLLGVKPDPREPKKIEDYVFPYDPIALFDDWHYEKILKENLTKALT